MRTVIETRRPGRVAIGVGLAAASAVWAGLSACGPSTPTSMDDDGSTTEAVGVDTGADDGETFGEPRPPDLGADVVICGQPGENVSTDEQVAALAGCEIFDGGVSLDYPNLTDLGPLASVRIMRGRLGMVAQNPGLETLTGLDGLEWVGGIRLEGEVQGEGVDKLEDLSAFGSLTAVEATFTLDEMRSLTSLRGLERLRSVGSRLAIQANPELRSLDGLAGLEWIGGDLIISTNDNLESLDGLASLQQVGGDVWIMANPALLPDDVDAFVGRIEIGGVVHLD